MICETIAYEIGGGNPINVLVASIGAIAVQQKDATHRTFFYLDQNTLVTEHSRFGIRRQARGC